MICNGKRAGLSYLFCPSEPSFPTIDCTCYISVPHSQSSIICRGVLCFTTGCPCNVWCHGLTRLLGGPFLEARFSAINCRFDGTGFGYKYVYIRPIFMYHLIPVRSALLDKKRSWLNGLEAPLLQHTELHTRRNRTTNALLHPSITEIIRYSPTKVLAYLSTYT